MSAARGGAAARWTTRLCAMRVLAAGCALALACVHSSRTRAAPRGPSGPVAASPEPAASPAPRPDGPVRGPRITIGPDVLTWMTSSGIWKVETTVLFENPWTEPLAVDFGNLRGEFGAPYSHSWYPTFEHDSPVVFAPGERQSRRLLLHPGGRPGARVRPTSVRFRYYVGQTTWTDVTVPTMSGATTGLTLSAPASACVSTRQVRGGFDYVHGGWYVDLDVTLENSTDRSLWVLPAYLRFALEDGRVGRLPSRRYCGGWQLEPRQRTTATLRVVFETSPLPPPALTLSYGPREAPPVFRQTISLVSTGLIFREDGFLPEQDPPRGLCRL